MRKYYYLAALTGLAFVLRFWQLANLPFPPDGDEVAFGYYGWSLLHFGTDEYGNTLPLFFISIGDYKYPGLAYLNILPALLFGLSDMTTRFWSAFSGVIGVSLVYVFSSFVTKNNKASLMAALFFAISPWSLIESRIGYENHTAFVITLGGFVLLLAHVNAIKARYLTSKNLSLGLGLLLFLVAVMTYAAQRIFIPLYLLVLFSYSFISKDFARARVKLFGLFVLMSGISILLFINPNFRGRASEEAWKFSSEHEQALEVTYSSAGISEYKPHPRLTWLLHNKHTLTGLKFAERYLDHFNPKFLFIEGEASDESIPGMGVLLLADMILLPLGALFLYGDERKESMLVFAWILLAPLPSALTHGGAHINRASLLVVPFSLLSGYGLYSIGTYKNSLVKAVFTVGISAFVLWSFLFALHQLFVIKPNYRPWFKQQVNRELTQKVLALKDRYEAVVVGDNDYIFYLFYGRISPQEFVRNSDIEPVETVRWRRVGRLYNIYYKMPFNCPLSGKEHVLYVCQGDEIPQNSRLIDLIRYKDGLPAYSFIEFYPISKMPKSLPVLPERLRYMVDTEKPDGNPDGIIPKEGEGFW